VGIYEVVVRILGREPGDIPRILQAVENAAREVCRSSSRGPSWVMLGCEEGLIVAQAEALPSRRLGEGALIECTVSVKSEDPRWIVNLFELLKSEATTLGYPILLRLREVEERLRGV